MAYVLTETITTIPWYYVKVELIANSGTGTSTGTNRGIVMNIGDLETAIDAGNSAYKPGDISIQLRNVSGLLSTNFFVTGVTAIELRIWLSYDAGTSYENFFCGFIDIMTRDYRERDTTLTNLRIYSVKAYDSILSLREVATSAFATNPPANLVTETGVPLKMITADTLRTGSLTYSIDFASFDEILLAALENIPFVSGTTAPTVAIDTSALDTHVICYHDANSSNDFSDIYGVWTLPAGFPAAGYAGLNVDTNYGETQWRASLRSAGNMLEALRTMMESFLMYPATRLTESGGAYTYTVYFEPLSVLVTGNTVTGSLGVLYVKDGTFTQWYDGIDVSTINMPVNQQAVSSYGGKIRQFVNRFTTCLDIGIDLYYLSKVDGRGLGETPLYESHGFGGQMLYFRTCVTMYNALRFHHRSSQSAAPYPAVGDTTDYDLAWYGVQDSLANIIIDRAATQLIRPAREMRKTAYKTLRDPGAAAGSQLFALRHGVDTTIDSIDMKAYKVRKSIAKNITSIEWLEED